MIGRWLARVRRAPGGGAEALEAARALERAGQLREALAAYRALVEADPSRAAYRVPYGKLLAKQGELAAGRAQIEAAIASDPASAEAWALLGNIERASGLAAAAERAYRRAVELDASIPLGAHNLGVLLREQGRIAEALEAFERALAAGAGPEGLTHLVHCLVELGRADEARARLEAMVARADPQPHANALLGVVLLKQYFDAPAALARFDAARAAGLDDAELHANRGIALQDLGRVDEAIAAYGHALELDPAFERARWQRSLAWLLKGEFAAAWPDYELRLKDMRRAVRAFPYPHWQGEPLGGKRILLIAEQGIGDEIMFASCIPDLERAGATCVIDCAPKLAPLFARSFPRHAVHGGLQTAKDVSWARAHEPIDVQVHVGSLPRFLRTGREAFPRHEGYLRANPESVAAWRARHAARGAVRRIGIAWRGGTLRSRAPLRSLTLEQVATVLWRPGIEFVSLQHDSRGEEEAALRARGIAVDYPAATLADFDETAALVASLELVVSVCSSVVHLSGALGIPVWVLAPMSPEWRYLAQGETLPWYPSARVFRQSRFGDWEGVLARVRDALARRAGEDA